MYHGTTAKFPEERRQLAKEVARRHEVTFQDALIAHFYATEFPTTFKSVCVEQELFKGMWHIVVKFKNGREVGWEVADYEVRTNRDFYKNPAFLTMCAMVHSLTDESHDGRF